MAKRSNPGPDLDVEEEVQTHLYRVTFRRTADLTNRSRTYVTFGTSEDDAINRIWVAFAGSKFQTEFDRDGAVAEFIIGGVLKIGGS